MANPSLQIGNDNWAIKEDNLLGYSTAGTRFVPQPITMTRATLGTRVNPSGLVETVELLGSELVTNGDFATDSSWIKGTGWSIAGGNATLAVQAASSSLSSNTMSVTVGKLYKITINVSATSSGFRLYDSLGVVSYGLPLGESVFYRTPSSSIYTVTPLGLAGASGIVTSVSVKEYQANDLARVDYTDGTSSLLVEPMRTNLIPYSEDLTQWNVKQATETLNYGISPDGTQNSTRLVFASSNLQFSNTLSTGSVTSGSIYAKGVSGETITFGLKNAESQFTFNGLWQRLEVQGTATSNKITVNTYGGVTARDFEVWGGQVEEGSYATSYIPTDGGTVTRVQETYEKTGISDKINSTEGVLFVEMAALSDDLTDRRISLNDGSNANEIIIGYSRFTGNIIGEVISGGSLQNINWGATGVTQTNNNKFALSWGSGTTKFYVNGFQTNIETGITSPIGLNTLKFSLGNDTLNMFAEVKQLQVYKTTDIDLATLTT